MSKVVRFPFLSFRSPNLGVLPRPILPALVSGQSATLRAWFILDSGADVSLIPYKFGRQLGMSRAGARRCQCGGIGEGLLTYYLCPVALAIEDLRLHVRVGWCEADIPYFLLGRLDVFDLLDIEFRQSANCILLRPASASPA